jgi:hypothetical protein
MTPQRREHSTGRRLLWPCESEPCPIAARIVAPVTAPLRQPRERWFPHRSTAAFGRASMSPHRSTAAYGRASMSLTHNNTFFRELSLRRQHA